MKVTYKTMTVPIKCSKSDYKYLMSCNKISAEVWNKVLDIDEQYRKENEGKWIGKNKLQKLTKGCAYIHAKGIHHVAYKYLEAREAALKSKEAGRKDVLFPYKKKKYFVTIWDYQCIKVKDGKILLSRPMTKEKIDGKIRRQKPVVCHVKSIPNNIVQIELIFRDRLYLSIKYKEKSEYLQVESDNAASIDLGEIHSITSIDTCGNALIITGRKMRAIKQLRNKHQAELYRKLKKCKYGSNRYWKIRKSMRRASVKYERQINDAVHKTSKLFLDFCLENNISKVYYGDVDSATRSTKKLKKVGSKTRQKLAQWNYGQLILQFENKFPRHNIKLVKINEAYTSQKCPSCKSLNKTKTREYFCKCGYEQHRDIVGAINILNDNHQTELTIYKNKKYLRIS
ncbi:transposase [Priestia megaterium]